MNRRLFLGSTAAASLLAAVRPPRAHAAEGHDVDPYFLDAGDLSDDDQRELEELVQAQEAAAAGRPVLRPRGSDRAPTFRFLHWRGEPGDPRGSLVGPLSLRPAFRRAARHRVNAQILDFHTCPRDWRAGDEGTLTLELRGRGADGDPMTWLFAEVFECHGGGGTTLSRGFLAQRDGRPDPVETTDPSLDVRIQLMRTNRKTSLFPRILGIAAGLLGTAVPGGAGSAVLGALPALRIPRLAAEGVALSRAVLSGATDEKPIWRSGLASYGIAEGGSRLVLVPGLWVVLDDGREPDLRGVVLGEDGGHLRLTRDGRTLDINHLVLDVRFERDGRP